MATKKKPEPKAEPLSAKEAATKIGTDARTLRKYLRSVNGLVGQGNRWAIEADDLDELKKGFDAWHKAGAKGKTTRPTLTSDAIDEEDIDEVTEFEDEDDNPEVTNDELEEIDLEELETLS